jgi:hypothetical protein
MCESNISMQQLKEQRLTPAEKFVLDAISGVKPDVSDEYSNVRWYKNGNWLFTQFFGLGCILYVNSVFSDVLKKEYGFNNDEAKQLLTKLLHKYTNKGQLKVA